MANGIGLSPEFLARNRAALDSIASGPSVAEVTAARPTGLGLSSASAAPGVPASSGIGLRDVARTGARVIGAVASLGMSEAQRALVMEQQRQQAVIEDQIKAQTRQQNLKNLAGGLDVVADIVRQIGAVRDPEARAAVVAQYERSISEEFPEWLPAFRGMVDNAALAYTDREKMLGDLIKRVPEIGAAIELNNGDLSQIGADAQTGYLSAWSRSQARDSIPRVRTKIAQIRKQAAKRFPGRFMEMIESDRALSSDELTEMVQLLADEDPDLNNPAFANDLDRVVRFFPEAVGVQPQEDVEAMRTFEEKERIKAKYSKPGVVVNVGSKGGKERVFEGVHDQVFEKTGNELLANRIGIAAIQNQAFTDPILGEFSIGNAETLEKARAGASFFDSMNELEKAAQDVVKEHRDTSVLDEGTSQLEAMLTSGDPALENYGFWLKEVAFQRTKMISGAQATDAERKAFRDQLPTPRSLAAGGKFSETATRKFESARTGAINQYSKFFQAEQQEDARQRLSSRFQTTLRGAESGTTDFDDDALIEQAEAYLQKVLGRQPTPAEINDVAKRYKAAAGR